jgi:hypothetical protein
MVVAAVDDLMFASKISSAARRLGVEVVFAKTPDEVKRAAARQPSLLIFFLNGRGTDPLATLAAIKADAALGGIRCVGFVSHVQGDRRGASGRSGRGARAIGICRAAAGDPVPGSRAVILPADVFTARRRIAGRLRHATRALALAVRAERASVHLKLESLQLTLVQDPRRTTPSSLLAKWRISCPHFGAPR